MVVFTTSTQDVANVQAIVSVECKTHGFPGLAPEGIEVNIVNDANLAPHPPTLTIRNALQHHDTKAPRCP